MYLTYPVLFAISFFGTKLVGLDRTLNAFQEIGMKIALVKKIIPWSMPTKSIDNLEKRIARSYRFIPLPIQCLDQAVVGWYLLNIHGYAANLKIGLSLTPLRSHAWVEVENWILGDTAGISDLKVVAEYLPWTRSPRSDF